MEVFYHKDSFDSTDYFCMQNYFDITFVALMAPFMNSQCVREKERRVLNFKCQEYI